MLVRDHMSEKVITVERDCRIDAARALLAKRRIRQLPVVGNGRLLGIVTDRDLRSAPANKRTVGDVMTAKPVTIEPDAPVDEAAQTLRTLKIGALPVLENRTLVGILTASDVLDAFVELSGVGDPTYHLTLTGSRGLADWQIRRIIEHKRGEVKWMYPVGQRRAGRIHVRVKTRDIDRKSVV